MPAKDDPVLGSVSPGDIGRIGESLARRRLEARGYRIIESNYRCRWGEVDLVARDGPTWVFVEVRTRRRSAFGSPEESVTAEKAHRLVLTAQDFLDRRKLISSDVQWRIDLVAIRLGPGRRVLDVQHLKNVVEQ